VSFIVARAVHSLVRQTDCTLMAQLIGEVTAEQVRNHKKRWRMLQVSAGTEKWLSATLTLFLEQGTTCSVQINGARCHLSARLITRFIQQLRDTRHE
jgi:hypothetical protein